MNVRHHDNGSGPRIIVELGGEEIVLGVVKAAELRDALTSALRDAQLMLVVKCAVDAALGEVARQQGSIAGEIAKEARGCGLSAGEVGLSAIAFPEAL